jgi:hypothetical protein
MENDESVHGTGVFRAFKRQPRFFAAGYASGY